MGVNGLMKITGVSVVIAKPSQGSGRTLAGRHNIAESVIKASETTSNDTAGRAYSQPTALFCQF